MPDRKNSQGPLAFCRSFSLTYNI